MFTNIKKLKANVYIRVFDIFYIYSTNNIPEKCVSMWHHDILSFKADYVNQCVCQFVELLERLLINNQLQQMTGQGTGSAMNFGSASFGAPSLGGANLGGGMFSAGGLSDPGMGLLDTSGLLTRSPQPPSLNFASLLDSMSPPRASFSSELLFF